METRRCDVALVSMPWAPPIEPCLGLAILKSCLARAGITARVFHFGPDLLRWITHDTYQFVADSWGLNEFVFGAPLDDSLSDGQKAMVVQRVLASRNSGTAAFNARYDTPESMLDLYMTLRCKVMPEFLDDAAARILDSGARLIGFTCMFDQTIASVALAAKLKRLDPTVTVVLGGYALEGPAAGTIARAFPCVDHLVLGDGEQAIVELAEGRRGERVIRAARYDLADSPTPDYDDWFADVATLDRRFGVRVETEVLPVEASRGCWWGQTMHCVFCGIDEDALTYRYKSADQTFTMLDGMRRRYGDLKFRFSDYIMPKAYYTDLLPRLAEQQPKFRLHSEIKANHPPERVRLLARAGFHAVQPGIESFATPVLRMMDKGVRGIDNVSLLKAAYAEGIDIYYNLLYGLPDDSAAAYRQMVELIPRLYHLTPPVARTETVLTRFSPLQAQPQRFGLPPAVHHASYDALFSEDFLRRTGFSLDDYCYYFERTFDYPAPLQSLYAQLVIQVDHWKRLHRERFVELSTQRRDGATTIRDSRFCAQPEVYTLTPPAALVYESLREGLANASRLRAALDRDGRLAPASFDAAMAELDQRRLIWQEHNLVLGLAIAEEVTETHRATGWPQQWHSIRA